MSPDDMAFWIYSSGTTGRPKAAVHLHRNVLISDRHLVENLGVKPGDRLLCSSKLFFAFSLGHLLLGGLRAGAAIILHKGWPEPNSIATLVKTQRPDYFFSVPTFYRNLLNAGVADDPAFANIRCCVSAGEGLPTALFEKWQKKTGTAIFEGIGSSETVYLFIANNPASFRAGSSGRPQPWVETRLFDDNQQPVTNPDTPGLLWVKMGSACDRYWNRPHKSHDTFVDGWYCTGDMFSFDAQGWWQHLGRQDAMLKISGQWVSPIEIEEQAMSANNVVDAAVVGAVNEDGLTRAMMFVVPGNPPEDRETFCQDLTNHLRKKLSIYKCPRKIRLVEQLPRTDTGKLKRFVLRQWMDDQAFH